MKKFSKKLSLMLVLAMIVGLFSGAMGASAASIWSFKALDKDKEIVAEIEVGGSLSLEKGEFANIDLFKSGVLVGDEDATYDVVWSSSDPAVVWVDAANGKLRADKNGEMTEDYGTATISATFTNKTTNKSAVKSFDIEVGSEELDYELAIAVLDAEGEDVTGEVLVVGKEYTLKDYTINEDGEKVSFAETKMYRTFIGDVEIEDKKFTPAEAGEFEITVLGYFDKEVVPADAESAELFETITVEAAVDAPEFLEAKQTKMDTVEITVNDAAYVEALAKDINLLDAISIQNELEISAYVKSVEAKKDDAAVAVVTLHNELIKDVTYKFGYVGFETEVQVVGAESKPASIAVVSKTIDAKTDSLKAEFTVLNALGVDITSSVDTALITWSADESSDYYLTANGDIYFFEANKTAAVKVSYDMGYDDEGNEIADLTATGTYTSKAPATASSSNPNGYAFVANTEVDLSKSTFSTGVQKLAVGDTLFVAATYTLTAADGKESTKYIINGVDKEDATRTFKYYSSKDAVALIDETTGQLTAITKGNTSITMKNSDGKVVGVVNIAVGDARGLSTFTATPDVTKLSSVAGEKIVITFDAKDQLGNTIALDSLDEVITYPADKEFDELFALGARDADGKANLTAIEAAGVEAGKSQVFKIKFTAKQGSKEISKVISITVKNVSGVDAANVSLTLDKSSVDMKLDQGDESKYNVAITVVSKDKDGYFLGNEDVAFKASKSAVVTTATEGYAVVIKQGDDFITEGSNASNDGTTTTIKPVTVAADVISKMKTGNVVISLYKTNSTKVQFLESKNLTLTDSTAKITVVQESNKIDVDAPNYADIIAALKFNRGTTEIDTFIDGIDLGSSTLSDEVNSKLYIYKLKLEIAADELKDTWNDAYYSVEEVAVEKLFEDK